MNPGHPPRQDGALPLSYVPTKILPAEEALFLARKYSDVKANVIFHHGVVVLLMRETPFAM